MRKIDPILLVLLFGMLGFTGVIIFVNSHFPDEDALFTLIAGILGGFSAAFFARVKHFDGDKSDTPPAQIPPPGSTIKPTELTTATASTEVAK